MNLPPDDRVDVWCVPLDAPDLPVEALAAALPTVERARAAELSDQGERRRFVATRGAARALLGAYLRTPPDRLEWRRGRWGKPSLAGRDGPQFSLSHTDRLALVAVSRRQRVGVDVERHRRPDLAVRLASRYFPAPERDAVAAEPAAAARVFARLWTRKEACVKAAGERLAWGLRLPVAGADAPVAGRWRLRDVPVTSGYAAAVALETARPFEVVLRPWRL